MKSWCKNSKACIECLRDDRKHMAKSLCSYCYLRSYHNNPDNVERCKKAKNLHYITKQKHKAKKTREARNFSGNREAVLIRDLGLCQICKAPGDIVHHIDGNGRGSEKPNNSMENLTTLCRACHIQEHRELLLSSRFKPGVDGWAKNYDVCVLCKKSDSKHNSKGRCARCVAKLRRGNKI